MVQTSNFKPSDEFIFYQALVEAGILPKEGQTEMWNNPDSVVHKAWLYFESRLTENNKENNCEKSWQATKYIVVVQSIEYVEAENYEDAMAVAVENAKDNLKAVDWKIVG